MTGTFNRVCLLAAREFKAYVASITFWIALALGPVTMVAMVATAQLAPPAPHATPLAVEVNAPDDAVRARAVDALRALGSLTDTPVTITDRNATTRVVLRQRNGQLTLENTGPQLLPPLARAFLLERIARQTRDADAHPGDDPPAPTDLTAAASPSPIASPTAGAGRRIGAFAIATILWMTLTGSMGMLLQAVVRERANRSLEILLALARPLEVVIGKLAGVGAVSVLVVGAWIGTGAALAAVAPTSGGMIGALMSGMSEPAGLARSAVAFVLAYLLYGLATVAIGSAARDTAAAQNLSRPMFGILLLVFLVIASTLNGTSDAVRWLVFVPPFTPFLLILGSYGWPELSLAVGLLLLAIILCAAAAQHSARLKA